MAYRSVWSFHGRVPMAIVLCSLALQSAGVGSASPDRARASLVNLEAKIGQLRQDGPATPEQVALYLPIEAEFEIPIRAEVQYTQGGTWAAAHPLFLIQPRYAIDGAKVPTAFAGVITGLQPGERYQVEVTVRNAYGEVRRSLEASTSSLPAAAPAPTKRIAPRTKGSDIQRALAGLKPGDVLLFENGEYEVDALTLKVSGTVDRPIYIRGESRNGVTLRDTTGRVLYLVGASDVVIENLTLEGSGTDSGTAARSVGIQMWSEYTPKRVTLRNLLIRKVDQGIVGSGRMEQFLIYDNTLVGNNVFDKETIESNASWNDDGIRVPGIGHAVFNNTLAGFGDALAVSARVNNVAVHFYRNRVLFTCDDAFEGDYAVRNVTFYDNRVQNSMTLASFDPLYGGPAFVFRNSAINVGRQPYKLNSKNTGMFFYNNTVVRIPGYRGGREWGWVQPDNGSLRGWGYRNNLLHFAGPKLLAIESTGNNPIDFTHNGWYPDARVMWTKSGGSFSSIQSARTRLPDTEPVFGDSRRRHDGDVIAEANPFETAIRFPSSYDDPVLPLYEPKLAPGSRLRGAGAIIPGVTDSFAGGAPDIGAVITGRPIPVVGDRTP